MERAPPAPRPAAARRSAACEPGCDAVGGTPPEPRSAAARPRGHGAGLHPGRRAGPGGRGARTGARPSGRQPGGRRRPPPGHRRVRRRGLAGELSRADELAARGVAAGRPARPRQPRARADLRRPGAGRAAPRAQRARARAAASSTRSSRRARRATASRCRAWSPCSAPRLARVLGDEVGAGRAARPRPACSTPSPTPPSARCSARRRSPRRCGSTRRKAAALIAELDQDRVETQVLRARLALLEHDDAGAATLLADLPPADDATAPRVERNVLGALSVLERRRRAGQPPPPRGTRRRPSPSG